jgi:hypothetical protein
MGALNKIQMKMLIEDGFLPSEIMQLNRATAGNTGAGTSQRHIVKQSLAFNSKPFLAMRRSRRRWVHDLQKLGWADYDIKLKIREFYNKGSSRDIYSFLKIEYHPPHKLSDYSRAITVKNRSQISRTLGKLYGRNLRTATKVRTQPKRPIVPFKPRRIIRVKRRR